MTLHIADLRSTDLQLCVQLRFALGEPRLEPIERTTVLLITLTGAG